MSRAAQWILRIGVAFAFAYPALNAVSNPDSWIGYFPQFLLTSGVPHEVLLHGFGVVEIILAVWILWGWRIEAPAAIATLMLVAIVVLNLTQFEVLFRDLSIAAASAALAADAWAKRKRAALEAS